MSGVGRDGEGKRAYLIGGGIEEDREEGLRGASVGDDLGRQGNVRRQEDEATEGVCQHHPHINIRHTYIGHPRSLSNLAFFLAPYLGREEQVGLGHGIRHGPGVLLLREGGREGEREGKSVKKSTVGTPRQHPHRISSAFPPSSPPPPVSTSYLLPLKEEDEAMDGLKGAERRRVKVVHLFHLRREGGG